MPAKMKVRGRPKGISQTAIRVPKRKRNDANVPVPFTKKHREDKTRCKQLDYNQHDSIPLVKTNNMLKYYHELTLVLPLHCSN